MSISGNKVFNIICGIFVGSFILYLIYAIYFRIFISKNIYEKYGIWTIGTVTKVEGGSKGGGFFVLYNYDYNNKEYKDRDVVLENVPSNIELKNKKFLIRILSNNVSKSNIHINYPVPDSIKTAPPEGWKKLPSWAKKKNDEE